MDAVALVHPAEEVLEIHLVHDPDSGRYDPDPVEGLRAPFQETVALAVARELDLHVLAQCIGAAVAVDLHRVVDDEIRRHARFDHSGIAAQPHCGGAHCGEVDEQRHAGEVLEEHAGDDERHFLGARGVRRPGGERAHVLFGDTAAVAVAQHGLEHDADRDRQAGDIPEARLLDRVQAVESALSAPGQREFAQAVEGVAARVRLTAPRRSRSRGSPGHHSFLWLPSHIGRAALCLQPQNQTFSDFAALYSTGVNGPPLCEPSQNGCVLLLPQAHHQ